VQSFMALAVPRLRKALKDMVKSEGNGRGRLPKPATSC
jgi:hypothetical protein